MKFLKLFSLLALGIFLISSASAMVLYGGWGNGTQQTANITQGQSIIFNADFFSMNPPMTISAKLYNSNDTLNYTFLSTNMNGNGYSSYQPTYNITPLIYSIPGNYQIIINGNDKINSESITLYLTVNPIQNQTNSTNQTVPPIVNLISPINNFISNSSLITFNGTVSDNLGISNVSLIINGNQTNVSRVNSTDYLFIINLSNGIYFWNYQACDISGICALGTNRTLTINLTSQMNSTNSTNVTNQTVPPSNVTNSNPEISSGYSYVDVYQNQYLQQSSSINQGINLSEPSTTSNSSIGFAFLLFEILIVLVLIGIIIFVFAKRRFS
jgi:hypothetical protein